MASTWTVRPSPIHGFGVFATAAIPQGFAIGALDCMKFARWQMIGEPATGVVCGDNQMAVMGGFPLWYVNYSDEPNIQIVSQNADDTVPFVVTTRMIHPGEELTISNSLKMPV